LPELSRDETRSATLVAIPLEGYPPPRKALQVIFGGIRTAMSMPLVDSGLGWLNPQRYRIKKNARFNQRAAHRVSSEIR
jgi:hypothetical protein